MVAARQDQQTASVVRGQHPGDLAGFCPGVAAGHAEAETMRLLAQARVSFGIALGHLLPEERLATAARWTGRTAYRMEPWRSGPAGVRVADAR